MPEGFQEAYTSFTEAGWVGLDMPEEYGGQALPLSIQVAFAEMVNGACLSFAMLPLMLRAASSLLMEHASKDIVDKTRQSHAGSGAGRRPAQADRMWRRPMIVRAAGALLGAVIVGATSPVAIGAVGS